MRTVVSLQPPLADDTWLGLTDGPLPVGAACEWAVRANCGGLVMFNGTARDHATDRLDVTLLEYEAYEEQVLPRLGAIADEMRLRWPTLGRIALLHRIGEVCVGESAVISSGRAFSSAFSSFISRSYSASEISGASIT